ncbi:MAG: hypothetical protein DWQ29_00070 [Planctomycetota bacterium]|nr:MAG: hypothetical protein DWQ29_00070 [Planctomycetota bacterium]
MQFSYRRIERHTQPDVADHELWVVPAEEALRERRDLACLAVEQGPDAFLQGCGPITECVLQHDPTPDDMLAAAIIERRLRGEEIPAGISDFARYVQVAREGLRPGTVPVEVSLEGIHSALRNLAGSDLTDAATASKFTREWRHLADCIFRAAADDVDPFQTSIIADNVDFARPRAFLQQDQKVYRQDVARGERWIVSIPDGPPKASGLLLKQPKSLLWKYWARADEDAPIGGSYLFTALYAGEGNWIFSTDPVQRQSIQGLSQVLQEAERSAVGPDADQDPWFDGKPFGYTLVAAPRRKTQLSERQVLQITKRWAGAKRAPRPKSQQQSSWAMTAVALAAVAAVVILLLKRDPLPEEPGPPEIPRVVDTEVAYDPGNGQLFVLSIGISDYADPPDTQNSGQPGPMDLNFADDDARALHSAFRRHTGRIFKNEPRTRLICDPYDAGSATDSDHTGEVVPSIPPTREQVLKGLLWLEGKDPEDREKPPGRDDLVIITISGHGVHHTETDDYYLLCSDHAPGDDPRLHGLSWTNDIAPTLNRLSCTVLVILDTCHAGAALSAGDRGASPDSEFDVMTDRALASFKDNAKTVLVLPACLGDQKAKEKPEWGHGALTLSILEAIEGETVVSPTQKLPPTERGEFVVGYHHLEWYAQNRVWDLTSVDGRNAQLIEASSSNERAFKRNIPLAQRDASWPH